MQVQTTAAERGQQIELICPEFPSQAGVHQHAPLTVRASTPPTLDGELNEQCDSSLTAVCMNTRWRSFPTCMATHPHTKCQILHGVGSLPNRPDGVAAGVGIGFSSWTFVVSEAARTGIALSRVIISSRATECHRARILDVNRACFLRTPASKSCGKSN